MTNEELVNNIVCKNCRVPLSIRIPCNVFDKEYCFIYDSALQVAKEKDKQYFSTEFILKILEINSNISDRSCPNTVAKEIIKRLKNENNIS